MTKAQEVVAAIELSVLRGHTPEESRQIAEEIGGKEFKQSYIDNLRAGALRQMRERFQKADKPIMNFAALRQVLDLSARQRAPLDDDAIRLIADMAGEKRTEVLQAHQERHEAYVRAAASNRIIESWGWRLYDL